MNIGLLMPFRNPPRWHIPFPEFYEEQLQQVELAEDLGYDTIWLTEHHFSEDGYSPSILPIAAAIAARTNRVRIGTFLLLLPLHHPVEVGEAVATIDVLSNGRFDLGVGLGYVPREFAGYGVSRRERASRLEEGLNILKGMWTEAPFAFEGRHYQVSDISVAPRPVQTPHPPLWVGSIGPQGIERAARLGCHYLGLSEPTAQETYDAALCRYGRDPADFSAAQLRFAYVAPTTDQAWDEAQDHLHYMLSMYARWLAESQDHDGDFAGNQLPPADQLRHTDGHLIGAPLIGSPEDVLTDIEQLCKTVRTTHLVLGMHLPGLDPARTRRSMELFAKEVAPNLS